jgi:hypothetical protein
MSFAQFLQASRERGDLDALDTLYLHRTHRQAHGRIQVGRDAIRAALIAERAGGDAQQITVETDLGDVLCISGSGGGPAWRRHHWIEWEGGRIARELVIGDSAPFDDDGGIPCGMFRPLGERRAGAGQLPVGERACLAEEPSPSARRILDGMHAVWNGRDLSKLDGLYEADAQWRGPSGRSGQTGDLRSWISEMLTALPDSWISWMLFERVVERGDQLAVLWRLVVDEGLRRLHVGGSTILTLEDGRVRSDDTLIDEPGLARQRSLPMIEL